MGSQDETAPVEFGREWPWVRGEVLRTLAGRQVPAADAEDIVQEVAVRALARPQAFATREDLARWSWRVAWRLRIDAIRRDKRLVDAPTPDLVSADDTARLVEGRLAVEQTLAGMTALSTADRDALFAVTAPDASRQDAVRLAVRRHRARTRLRRASGLAGVLGWLAGLWRRLRAHIRVVAVAGPVVLIVALELGSLLIAPHTRPVPSASEAGDASIRSALDVGVDGPAPPRAHALGLAASRRAPSSPAASPSHRNIASVPVGDNGVGVFVGSEERPDPPTACIDDPVLGHVCVDRPGPHLPLDFLLP